MPGHGLPTSRLADRAGEIFGRTIGILGYGRIGREEKAPRVRLQGRKPQPVADPMLAGEPFRRRVDRMLPQCDALISLPGWRRRLTDDRCQTPCLDETRCDHDRARRDCRRGVFAAPKEAARSGAASSWWQTWSGVHPDVRPSRFPFHELPNVLMTPHCSGFTEGTAARRWSAVAGNLDRFASGEPLENVVLQT